MRVTEVHPRERVAARGPATGGDGSRAHGSAWGTLLLILGVLIVIFGFGALVPGV